MLNRRTWISIRAAAVGALLALAGCGGNASTDPATLSPLSESDKAEIQKRDAEVQAEEGGNVYGKAEKGKAARR